MHPLLLRQGKAKKVGYIHLLLTRLRGNTVEGFDHVGEVMLSFYRDLLGKS